MQTSLPWYRSKIIIGAIISITTKVLVVSGLVSQIAPEDSEALTNLLVLLGGGVGDLMALVARLMQKAAPPISLRK
jgi:hypothetical protein